MCDKCDFLKEVELENYVACPDGMCYGATAKEQYKMSYKLYRKYLTVYSEKWYSFDCQYNGISQKISRLAKASYMISQREEIPTDYHAKQRWHYLRAKAQSEQQISAGDVVGLSYPA